MSMFTERPDEFSEELREAGEWLHRELEAVAGEKGLTGVEWRFRYGKRQSGGTGGVPEISQWGFQVAGIRPESGETLPLSCFLEESTVLEERGLARRILDLWMDRVLPEE